MTESYEAGVDASDDSWRTGCGIEASDCEVVFECFGVPVESVYVAEACGYGGSGESEN